MITAADIGAVPTIPLRLEPLPDLVRYQQPVIAVGKVRYVGEPIAVAAALRSLGVEPRELPLSPPRVWQMIQNAANLRAVDRPLKPMLGSA